uniref:Superoxide dismutase n=1 Tax=Spongospora subterranea TaxID=70186 RepID=A0A0H5R474_9EUKA|eukprot:CRZ09005.1 hypothetical protein [Spongospora subterranea]
MLRFNGKCRRLAHSLPALPYAYEALEPVISKQIMELHHQKHHQTYVNNLNALLETAAKDPLPLSIQKQAAIKFNGGGHLNHSIFWTNLAPVNAGGGQTPTSGALYDSITDTFGGFPEFISKFSAQAAAVQGSGWAWLTYNQTYNKLEIVTTSNQDPIVAPAVVPILGVDVWEHAYYLDYKNARPEYLKHLWKVVNWDNVGERFDAAQTSR